MALKLKTSNQHVGDQRKNTTNHFITNEVMDKLDGLNLYQAQKQGLIEVLKFEEVETEYVGNDGKKTFSRIEMITDKGAIIVGKDLGEDLASWADNLGDLVCKKGISNRDGKTEFFRLQRPGGGVTENRTALAIGEEEIPA